MEYLQQKASRSFQCPRRSPVSEEFLRSDDGLAGAGDRSASVGRLVRTLQLCLVERQVGDQPLQLGILLLDLFQPPDLDHAHPGELLLPSVERELGDTELAADLLDRCAGLGLPQSKGDLLVCVSFPLCGTLLQGSECPKKLRPGAHQFSGSGPAVTVAPEQGPDVCLGMLHRSVARVHSGLIDADGVDNIASRIATHLADIRIYHRILSAHPAASRHGVSQAFLL